MVEDVSTGVGCKKYISMVESAVKKISEQRKVSRHQEGLWIGHSPRMSLQRIRLRMQVGYHYLSGIIKLKKLDSHSLNILAATFYEHYERMEKKTPDDFSNDVSTSLYPSDSVGVRTQDPQLRRLLL